MSIHWPQIPLGKIAVSRGGSVDPSKYTSEDFDLYSIPAYDSGKPEVLPGSEIGSTKKVVQPDDVLLSRIVPHIQRVWVVGAKASRRQIASSEWIVYRSKEFHPPFLRHALLSRQFHTQFMGTVAGVGGSLLRARPDAVSKIKIPLPPLPEQKRIAAILDKADAIRRKRRQALGLADQFLRAVFLDMFGDPATNPKGWKIESLGDHISDARNGLSRRRKESQNRGNIVLRLQDIKAGSISFDDPNRIALDPIEAERYKLIPGDIAFIRVNGNRDYVGRSAIFDGFLEDVFFNDHIIRVRLGNAFLPNFLVRIFNSAPGKHILSNKIKTSAGQHTISQDGISSINMMCPPRQLQAKFHEIEHSVTKRFTAKLGDHEIQSVNLFDSLTQRAFRGEL